MIKDFVQFLKEFNVISLAVGFIMGTASTSLIGSLVKDVLMPLIEPLMSVESWKEAVITIGPVQIGYGSFLAELINFVILALIIFIITKKLLKIERQKTT
ncbi:MAG: large conductance mechanosensitive channel protein MscL [Patescibacteria group bacterium]